ncbi:MAG: helix-turn-helix domain containing protein, partial [Trueperaceae bacterium]|nr:helix-turn-helix domain containing protein [Trueperaceae bacterium]
MAQVPEARHAESAARERVLDVAEALFQERGLARVTMRDVADALGMRQASLYHHAPGGKAQLYREVFERMIAHHRAGLEAAVGSAGPEVRARLRAIASWYATQRPMNFLRMMTSDMPSLGAEEAQALAAPAYAALMRPLRDVFAEAEAAGAIAPCDPDLLAGSFLAVLDAVAFAESRAYGARDQVAMAHTMVDVLLDGLRARP